MPNRHDRNPDDDRRMVTTSDYEGRDRRDKVDIDRGEDKERAQTAEWVRWAVGILVGSAIVIAAWIFGLGNRVTAIESSRTTESQEATRQGQESSQQRNELNRRLERIEDDVKTILNRLPAKP